jgi:iron complex outermembrane receptor protein
MFVRTDAARALIKKLNIAGLMTGTAVLCFTAGAAHAATSNAARPGADAGEPQALAEVVVTARRVNEDIQKVPVAVTAISALQLKQQSIITPTDLQFAVPSLTVTGVYGRLSGNYAIRGLSTGVSTYFAEAPDGPTQIGMPFFDLSSVQVLNGPQGTLFGRSGAAGAVLITPQHPNMSNYDGLFDVSVGDYGRAQITGAVSIPIVKDQLAMRIAFHHEHIDGYTSQIGNSATGTAGNNQKLDESNSNSLRVALEWKHDRFSNYIVYDVVDVDQAPAAQVLAGSNPAVGILNLPPAYAAATFGRVCTTAVGLGLSPNRNACIAQRTGLLADAKASLIAEAARTAKGGGAVRSTLASSDLPLFEKLLHQDVIDVAQYDFGDLGFTTLSAKNIFSYQTDTTATAFIVDGIAGLLENDVGASASGQKFSLSAQQIGNHATGGEGPATQTFTEEFQLHGDAGGGLLKWTAGAYYQYINYPKNLAGIPNTYRAFSGVLTPNLGFAAAYGFQAGGHSTEEAGYGQVTLDLARLGVHGLSITGGGRGTWDNTDQPTYSVVTNYVTGHYSPGVLIHSTSSSSGVNYTFSIDEQVTPTLLLYATARQGYVPGGANLNVGAVAANLPNFTQDYLSETVKDIELGVKADFHWLGMRGRIDADIYRDDFSNIQEQFTSTVNGQTALYLENVAAAQIQGAELHFDLIMSRSWDLSLNYSYTDAKYTNWIGQDPLNVAKPGNPICLTSSPTGYCFLNLKGNPFPYAPANQATLTVRYHLPIDPALGEVTLSATGYAQSKEYLIGNTQRVHQLLPSADGAVSQSGFGTLSARLEWNNIRGSRWSAAAFINNATNTTYALGGIPQLFTFGVATKIYAAPRMFGFNLSYKFGG